MPIVKRFFKRFSKLSEAMASSANAEPLPLSAFFDYRAIVILGEPGIGKTTAFAASNKEEGNAICCTVSEFLNFPDGEFWGKTIYLDALDEHRAEEAGQSVIAAIVGKLRKLGSPKVRLSCRTLEWHGGSDVRGLGKAAQGEDVQILNLLPLSPEDIETIVAEQVNDVSAFLDGARQRDLEKLLSNPETLKLYLEVYKDSGGWPETRKDLMKKSVALLLREENEQHTRVRSDKVSDERLRAAAEDLSAIHAFSNAKGFTLSKATKVAEHPPIQELTDIDLEAAGIAARSRLFESKPSGSIKPQHKTTGDFLAATALARRILKGHLSRGRADGHLSRGRAMSLITGKDGRTLSHLRDIYAWLIALLPGDGQYLLHADPFGALVYGDVAQWPDATRRDSLNILREYATKDDPWFRSGHWQTPLLGGLASEGMVEDFRRILKNEEDPGVTGVVLSALKYGSRLPEMGDDLLVFVRDESRLEWLKNEALFALINNCPDRISDLKEILGEVHSGDISDKDLALRTTLLCQLYPSVITPDEVVEYFVNDGQIALGNFGYFIHCKLVPLTPDEALPNLADAMIARSDKVRLLSDFDKKHMVGPLVIQLLKVHGDTATPGMIFKWLGLYLDKYGQHRLDNDHQKFIRAYIEGRDGLYEALFRYWLAHSKPSEDEPWYEYEFGYRVLHAAKPSSFCATLLSMAERESDQSKADMLFTEAANQVMHADPGILPIVLDDLYEFAVQHPRFLSTWDKVCWCGLYDRHFEHKLEKQSHQDDQKARRTADVKFLKSQIADLRAGRAIQSLRYGAEHWFGYSMGSDGKLQPFERLAEVTSTDIAKAMAAGFEVLLKGKEQHSPASIAELACKSQSHYVGYPILAGADIVAARSQEEFLALPDANLKAALAYRVLFPCPEHDWEDWIFKHKPALGQEVLEDVWRAEIKGGKTRDLSRLYIEKTENPVTLLILRGIQKVLTENPQPSAEILRTMLTAILQHGDPEVLRSIAVPTLQSGKLRGEKHTLWLATASLLDPGTYSQKLKRKAKESVRDMWAAYHILIAGAGSPMNGYERTPQLQMAISILGSMFGFKRKKRKKRDRCVSEVDPNEKATREINDLINALSGLPTQDAAHSLEALCTDQSLHEWSEHLLHAKTLQAKNMRDMTFKPVSPAEVCKFLANGAPANMQDLQATTLDILDDIAPTIHDSNTNRWKNFWGLRGRGKPERPKIENDCRDVLLDMMRPAFAARDITAEPEACAANDKRVDIRLTSRDIGTLPIEIKRDENPEVWSGMEEQLVRLYANDPNTHGRGVFLVFWFGDGNLAGPPKKLGISKPKTADELQKALERIKPNRCIEVRVMDVSKPNDG